MGSREILTVLLSTAMGFAAGGLSTRIYSNKIQQVTTLRAERFELVDAGGSVKAFWGHEASGDEVLAFEDATNRSVATIGVRSKGGERSPFLDFAGRDGKSRAKLELGWMDRPIFGLSDEKWEGRVLLGFIENDSPSPDDDNWALWFRHPDDASIGTMRDPINGSVSGTLILSDQKKLLLRVPTLPGKKNN
jgi:hypothetical protein